MQREAVCAMPRSSRVCNGRRGMPGRVTTVDSELSTSAGGLSHLAALGDALNGLRTFCGVRSGTAFCRRDIQQRETGMPGGLTQFRLGAVLGSEPPRDLRRLVVVSHAAMA